MYSTVLNIPSTPIYSTKLIYHGAKSLSNKGVNRKEIRLQNLRKLIAEAGSAAAVARRADTEAAYLSQLVNQRPTKKGTIRGVGDDLAERLEQAMGKPKGWMDLLHEQEVSEKVLAIAREIEREADPKRIEAIYRLLEMDGRPLEKRHQQRRQNVEEVDFERRSGSGRRDSDYYFKSLDGKPPKPPLRRAPKDKEKPKDKEES